VRSLRRKASYTLAVLLSFSASGARGAEVPPPWLDAQGYAAASTEMPQQQPFNVFQPTGPISTSAALGSPGGTDTSGAAAVYVDYGHIGISVGGMARKPDVGPSSDIVGSGSAVGEWSDLFTIQPANSALQFTQGTLVFSLPLSGTANADGAGGTQLAGGGWNLDVQLGTCDPGCTFSQQGSWIDQGPAGGGFVYTGDPIAGLMHVSVPIQFAASMPLDVKLSVYAQALGGVPEFATASGEFGHTLLWGGFESVTDSHGATVSDYTVMSSSGTDWSKPVSEPEQPAETISAAAVIAALASTRSCLRTSNRASACTRRREPRGR